MRLRNLMETDPNFRFEAMSSPNSRELRSTGKVVSQNENHADDVDGDAASCRASWAAEMIDPGLAVPFQAISKAVP